VRGVLCNNWVLLPVMGVLWVVSTFHTRIAGLEQDSLSIRRTLNSQDLKTSSFLPLANESRSFSTAAGVVDSSLPQNQPWGNVGVLTVENVGVLNVVARSPIEKDMFCFEGQCSLPLSRYSGEFPNFFLGVGPGRSGSTSLIGALRSHPTVVVGDARNHPTQKCCFYELYVLDNQERAARGQSVYVDFFTPDTKAKRGTHWFGEKTPLYSSHRLVPFRARAMFGPWLKLFLTWREPVEIFTSRYLQLYEEQRANLRNQTFTQWANGQLNNFRHMTKCRQEHLERVSLTERMIYDPSFPLSETAAVEEYLVRLCGSMGDGPHAALEGRGMFRRWAHVFDKRQILCVILEDQNTRMNWVFDRLSTHLSIDRNGFKNQSSAHKRLNASFFSLEKNQMQHGAKAVEQMWGTIAEIQTMDRESSSAVDDQRLFSELCNQ